MTISRYCAMCDISYNDALDSCPLCKTKQLLKMAEDEAVYNDDHGRKQERRADKLEAELEELKQKLLEVEQTTGILCDKCGWSMKFPDEPCRCELATELESIKELLIEVREQYYYVSCEKGGEYYKVRKKIDDLLDLNGETDE